MRFARGSKVKIRYLTPQGRKSFVLRWWNQVDALVAYYSSCGCTDFEVRGRGWKQWRRYSAPKVEIER